MENDQSSPEKRPGRGWGLGKKVFIAGVAITSAPLVVPPLLLLSTIGLACAVPLGVYIAALAATEKAMSSVLPLRPPPVGEDGKEAAEVEWFEDVAEEECMGARLRMERASIVKDDGEVIVMIRELESQEEKLRGEIDRGAEGKEGEYMVQESEVGPLILKSVKMLSAKTGNSTKDVDMYSEEKEQGGLNAEATEVKIEESIVHAESVLMMEKDIMINPSNSVSDPIAEENDNTVGDEVIDEEKSVLTPLESGTTTELPILSNTDETGSTKEDEAGDEEKKQEPMKKKLEAKPVESEYASFAEKDPNDLHDEILEEKPMKTEKGEDVQGALVPERTASAVADPVVHLVPTEHVSALEPSSLTMEHASIVDQGIDPVGSKTEKQFHAANNVNQEREVEASTLSSVHASVTEDWLPMTADIETRLFRENTPTTLLSKTEPSDKDQGLHSEIKEQGGSSAEVDESMVHAEPVVVKENVIVTYPLDAVHALSIDENDKTEGADVVYEEYSFVTPLPSAAATELPTVSNADETGLLNEDEAGDKEKNQDTMKEMIEALPLVSEKKPMNNGKGEEALGAIASESRKPAGSDLSMHVAALVPSSLSVEHASIVENADGEIIMMTKDPEGKETGLGREVNIGVEEKDDIRLDAVGSESENSLLASNNVDQEHKVKASILSSEFASVTEDQLPQTSGIKRGLFSELAPAMLLAETEPSAKDQDLDFVGKEQGGVSTVATAPDIEEPMLHALPDVYVEENIKVKPSDFECYPPVEKEDEPEGDKIVEEEPPMKKDKDEEIDSNAGLEKIRAPYTVLMTPVSRMESAIATELPAAEIVYGGTVAITEEQKLNTSLVKEDEAERKEKKYSGPFVAMKKEIEAKLPESKNASEVENYFKDVEGELLKEKKQSKNEEDGLGAVTPLDSTAITGANLVMSELPTQPAIAKEPYCWSMSMEHASIVENADEKTIVTIKDHKPKEIELGKEVGIRKGKDEEDIGATNSKSEKPLQVSLSVDLESESECLSSEYASAVEDQSSETGGTESRLSVELGPTILTDEAVTSTEYEVLHSEEKIWEQIYALRMIMGYNATVRMSCMEELRALYLFAGVQAPSSVGNSSELNHMLQFLKSIIGVK